MNFGRLRLQLRINAGDQKYIRLQSKFINFHHEALVIMRDATGILGDLEYCITLGVLFVLIRLYRKCCRCMRFSFRAILSRLKLDTCYLRIKKPC